MEMSFSPIGAKPSRAEPATGLHAILAKASARQADSRTVHVLRRAEADMLPVGDAIQQRIYYFAERHDALMAVRGAFWRNSDSADKSEFCLYQDSSVNFKHAKLNPEPAGEQRNLAGQGISRKL